jgi:hypothetical protein
MNKFSDLKFKDILQGTFFLLIMFSDVLSLLASKYFSYIDEIFAILCLLYFVFKIMTGTSINKNINTAIMLMVFSLLSGVIGNFLANYQTNLYVISLDILSTYKLFFTAFGLICFFDSTKNKNCEGALNFVFYILTIYFSILFILCILNLFLNIGMSSGVRYGIKDFAFIYGIPGIIINHASYFLVILLFEKHNGMSNKHFFLFSIITLLLVISTLKTRGMTICAFYIFSIYFFKKTNISIKRGILLISLFALLIGLPQFRTYFVEQQGARYLFAYNSIFYANKFFPFGTGFSTFGTGTAAQYYSKIYYEIGFNFRFGLSPDNQLFLNDTFWPAIFCELGYLGLFTFFLLFLFSIWQFVKHYKDYSLIIALFIVFDSAFGSIQSAYLTSSSMICLLVIGIACEETIEYKKINEVKKW